MASQQDISVRAGVSQSLVSRVLNGRAAEFGITAETAARVVAVATELGYRPNPAATMLLGGASRLVGVVVRSFADPFLTAILQELNRGALAAGRTLLVTGLEGDDAQQRESVRSVQRYRPDALVVVGTLAFASWDDALFLPHQPVVQIGLPTSDARILSCGIDEVAAANALVRHLRETGHTQLAVLGDQTPASAARAQWLTTACRQHQMHIVPDAVFLSTQFDQEAGREGARWYCERWSEVDRPRAIVVTGDLTAIGFIRELEIRGLTVPADVAVASYDDLPLAALMRPALTTIRQPARDLAAAAMSLVTSTTPRSSIQLKPELVVRESTRAVGKTS